MTDSDLQAQCVEAVAARLHHMPTTFVVRESVTTIFDRIAESGYVICKADDLQRFYDYARMHLLHWYEDDSWRSRQVVRAALAAYEAKRIKPSESPVKKPAKCDQCPGTMDRHYSDCNYVK